MDLADFEFRAEWFKDKETKLQEAAAALDCVGKDIGAIEYSWQEDYRFSPLKPAYDGMVTALTSGTAGCQAGVSLLNSLREGIVTTARAYLRAEAANAGLVSEVNRIINELDL